MNATEKLMEFKKSLLKLTQDAVNGGLPFQNVILELDQEKFKLQMMCLQWQIDKEASELSQKIVPAGFTMPFPRNGQPAKT